jgi:iron complex transport system substrate-binding protein
MYGEEGRSFGCWFSPHRVATQLKTVLSVGSCREPNVEFIRSLEPDLILAYASYTELADILEEQTGLPVACIDASGCLDFRMLELVAEIMGKQGRAEALIDYAKGKVEKIAHMRSGLDEKERVKVFFWGWAALAKRYGAACASCCRSCWSVYPICCLKLKIST